MERNQEGQEIYVSSMEKSAEDKKRVFPFIKKGVIVDMGAGAGAVTEHLVSNFPDSKIIAVDVSEEMINRLKERFRNKPQVEIVQNDVRAFNTQGGVDSILFLSTLHEVFSSNDYSHQAVINALLKSQELLKKGGRLIIRDGVQPEEETLYVRPIHGEAYHRFLKFVRDFEVRPMIYTFGTFRKDSFIQHKPQNYDDFVMQNFFVEMHSQDVSELLSKYHYSEINWPVEVKEQFGIWTLREYQRVLLDLGYAIIHAETYVLPYLLEKHYSRDFELSKLEDGKLVKAPYPPSTMILVAEKP